MTTEIIDRPLPTADRILTELFAPLTPAEFFDQNWDRQPLHLSAGPATARGKWLDAATILQILTTMGVSAMDVRMARDGAQLDVSAFSTQAWHHDWSSSAILDPDRVLSLHDDGVTILLESLDRYHLPTAQRARAIEQRFGCTLKSNAFLTPAGSNAFPLHNDTYDGIIIQLEGRKHWDLHEHPISLPLRNQRYEPDRDPLGPKLMSVDLEPGDLLYVPRGVIHRAEALGEPSLHLTLIPVWHTWYDYLDALIRDAAHRDLELRRGYRADELDPAKLDSLMRALESDEAIGRGFDRLRDAFVAGRRPLVEERWTDLRAYREVSTRTVVRARPEVVVSLIADDSSTLKLAWLQHELRFPAGLEPALRRLLGGDAVALDELPGFDPEALLGCVSSLVKAGLLKVEVAS